MAGDKNIPLLGATPFVIQALKKASAFGSTSKEGHVKSDDLYKEEIKAEETPVPIQTSSSALLVKILGKTNDLFYTVMVFPYGINGGGTFNARLFFGDRCWSSELPINTYLVVNTISLTQIGGN